MRTTWGAGLLGLVGGVHLVPSVAVLSRGRVESTYGVSVDDASIELLLRHRAVLFGLLGAGLVTSAFVPRHRVPMVVTGLVSLVSYIGLTAVVAPENTRLDQVQRLDVGLVLALMAAGWLTRSRVGDAADGVSGRRACR